MKGIALLGLLLHPMVLLAQMQQPSKAWTYLTSTVTPDLEFTATTVAGTGGTATHKMVSVVVYLESPAGRSAGAADYTGGTTGQATAYLPLCGDGICEDGEFVTSTIGTREWRGYQPVLPANPAQSEVRPVNAWVQWIHSSLSEDTIPKQNGEIEFVGYLQKSSNCEGVPVISIRLSSSPSDIVVIPEPNSQKAPEFQQNAGTVRWKIKTSPANQHGGTVIVSAGFEVLPSGCQDKGNPVISMPLTVSQ